MHPDAKFGIGEREERVLLATPTRRDADVSKALFANAGFICTHCPDITLLAKEITAGAGAVVLTERALALPEFHTVLRSLESQPSWSDLPVVLLLHESLPSPAIADIISSLSNVVLLERPAPVRSLLSAVRAALRARKRQYQCRDQMEVIRNSEIRVNTLKEQLESALEASQLGTFHCPVPLGVIEWNDRCKELFFLPKDTAVDFDLFYSRLHHEDRDRTRKAIEECVLQQKPYSLDYRVVSPEGEIRWLRATGKTHVNERGEPTRFDGTAMDVTEERQRVEERQQLLESERAARMDAVRANRMKDEFLGTLSHELRTPLNAILGWAQLVKLDPSDLPTVEEAVDVIDRNVRIQTQLIEDLLDISRIISGKVRLEIKPIDVVGVINSALESVLPAMIAKGIHLTKSFHPGVVDMNGDSSRLQQVLWNLLTNATKFTPDGGSIDIEVKCYISEVEVKVSDNGAGIDPEFLPLLFERFSQADGSTTRRYGGLGLGLSIVKQLVEMHGGSVCAFSQGLGMGAVFVLRFPRFHFLDGRQGYLLRHGEISQDSARGNILDLNSIKVLVVDDEADSREIIKRLLIGSRAIPATAASADEAESLLYSFCPDVILSDIGMAGRDGYELMRRIRGNGITTPAIALTAFARVEDRMQSIQAGYQAHVTKPFDASELTRIIAKLAGTLGNSS